MSRRNLLGGLAVLATAPAAALALPSTLDRRSAPNTDAELIRACARYLELERVMDDPNRPDRHMDFDKLPEHPEYLSMLAIVEAAKPQTPQGWATMAGLALVCDASIEQTPWDNGEGSWIAHRVLRHLAGPAVVREEERLAAAKVRRGEEADARRAATLAERTAPEPYRDTRPPQEKIEGARLMIRVSEKIIREAEAEIAAAAVAS